MAKYAEDGTPISFGDADVQGWMMEREVKDLMNTPLGVKVYYIGHFEGESEARHYSGTKARQSWLNGWIWNPEWNDVLLGSGVHCIGCGKFKGITTVVFSDDWPPRDASDPDWPFEQATCPICRLTQELWEVKEAKESWPRGKTRPLP